MHYYLSAITKYAVFKGRANRPEYWYFVLFNLIIGMVLSFIDKQIGTYNADSGYSLLNGIYSLFVIIPSLAVTVRRLHDTGRNGWMILIALIPIIGWIWLIVLLSSKGNTASNKYGPVSNAKASP